MHEICQNIWLQPFTTSRCNYEITSQPLFYFYNHYVANWKQNVILKKGKSIMMVTPAYKKNPLRVMCHFVHCFICVCYKCTIQASVGAWHIWAVDGASKWAHLWRRVSSFLKSRDKLQKTVSLFPSSIYLVCSIVVKSSYLPSYSLLRLLNHLLG